MQTTTPTTAPSLVKALIDTFTYKVKEYRDLKQSAHEHMLKNILIFWDCDAGDIFKYEFSATTLQDLINELRQEPGNEAEVLQDKINTFATLLIGNNKKKLSFAAGLFRMPLCFGTTYIYPSYSPK